MARPVTVTKERILSAALDLVRAGGLSALTARSLCARFEAAGGVMERKVFEDAVFSVSQPEPIALPSID